MARRAVSCVDETTGSVDSVFFQIMTPRYRVGSQWGIHCNKNIRRKMLKDLLPINQLANKA